MSGFRFSKIEIVQPMEYPPGSSIPAPIQRGDRQPAVHFDWENMYLVALGQGQGLDGWPQRDSLR